MNFRVKNLGLRFSFFKQFHDAIILPQYDNIKNYENY